MTLLGLFMVLFSILFFLGIYRATENTPYTPMFFGLITIFLPYSIYKQSKKSFYSNKRLQENIKYFFDEEKMEVKGESFNAISNWEKFFKVTELRNWILIYQNNLIANIIPKSSFTTEQLQFFKSIIRSYPTIKTNIK